MKTLKVIFSKSHTSNTSYLPLSMRVGIKIFIALLFACKLYTPSAQAQNPLSQSIHAEIGIGISTPFLHSGSELSRSASLRSEGLSYFENAEGNRRSVGNYGNLIGWSMAAAWYVPVKKVNGLLLGTAVRSSLTGSQPADGGYEEGFFFNFLSFGLAAKYYPLTESNVFLKADAGLASVFTKDRFLNAQNEQEFFHQFGIGTNASAALGYSLTPFNNPQKSIDLQVIYEFNSVRVEVNEIGDDQWNYSALTFMAAVKF